MNDQQQPGEKKKEEEPPASLKAETKTKYGQEGAEPSDGKRSTKVKIASKDWIDKKGYADAHIVGKHKGELTTSEGEIGLFYGKVEGKSELSYDLSKKEVTLTPVKVEVQGSLLHAEGKGDFDLGKWVLGLFKDKPKTSSSPNTPSGGAPFAARVGDLTGHGSPLAPGIGSVNVLVGGMPAWRATIDSHLCPVVKGLVPDVGGMVLVGCPTVLINSMMACRMGDMVVEIPGGPNPIAMGCPSVMIGLAGSGAAEPGTGLKLTGKAEGDFLTGKLEAELSAVANKDKVEAKAKAGAMVAVAKGSISGGISIPLWGDHSISLGASAEGSVLSAGAEGEASAGWSRDKGVHAKIGGKVGAGLAGAGLGFSIGIK